MPLTTRHNTEMVKKAEKALNTTEDPIEKLRASCLMRGANGISGLSRYDFKYSLKDSILKKICK
jgi:hypothetical protein